MSADHDPGRAFDLILAGGGLANGLIAWRLHKLQPRLRILLLEQDGHIGGNHTWSFHDADLDPAQQEWIAPLVAHRWPGYEVVFPDHARRLDGGYASIASSDFARVIEADLGKSGPNPSVRTGARIARVTPNEVVLAGGERLRARAVIDGRGPAPSSRLALGYQVFLGQELQLDAPHGLTVPTIMDAGVAQQGGYRFVYVLPLGPDRVLVEDTHYVDGPAVDAARLRANVDAYVRARGWRPLATLREEQGALPIVLAGDPDGYWNDLAGQPCAGLRAGLFHATTGYSLPHAVRLAERIAGLYARGVPDAATLFAAIRADASADWRQQGFYRLLNRMLFLAGRPDDRWRVMQRFYRLPAPLIARFYAGRTTLADKARLLSGKPPVPVGQALDAALRFHPHQIRPEEQTRPRTSE
jgi:lycopene beta-cyclase